MSWQEVIIIVVSVFGGLGLLAIGVWVAFAVRAIKLARQTTQQAFGSSLADEFKIRSHRRHF